MTRPAPEAIIVWMLQQIAREGRLYQEDAADEIARTFGPDFVHENRRGRRAIDKRIVKEFRRVAGDNVVWDREEFFWRRRIETDWRKGSGGRRL
jgi:hypothetical protein